MQTSLYDQQKALQAKFVPFGDFELPLYYSSILKEHEAVRTKAGVFDVSHMGRIAIHGEETLPFLDSLSVHTIDITSRGKSLYTVFCNESGGAIDDLLVFVESDTSAFLIANSSNREKVVDHLQQQAKGVKVKIEPCFTFEGILALQGRDSFEMIRHWAPEIAKHHFSNARFKGMPLILSRTGYTGEDGFELFGSREVIGALFHELTCEKGVSPCGLGARDLLRLEMGYALFGHELSASINPIESVASWCVKLSNRPFLGKQATVALKESGKARHACALIGLEAAIARESFPVIREGAEIGYITSGSFSPSLKKPIALSLCSCSLETNETVYVKIRESLHPFVVVKLPFLKRNE